MKRLKQNALCAVLALSAVCCGRIADKKNDIAVLRGPSAIAALHLMDSLSACVNPDMRICIFDEPMQLRKAMMDSTVDFAMLPTTMAALLYNKGVDYRMIAVPIWGSLYVCGSDTTINDIACLRGRKVNVMARGMTPDLTLRHLLHANGLDPEKDLSLDYRFPTHIDLANAAIAGRTELFLLSEPFVSQVIRSNGDFKVLIDIAEEWQRVENLPLAETAFLCRGSLVQECSPMPDYVTAALHRSAEWVKTHPDSAAVLAVRFGINPDTSAVKTSIPRSGFNVLPASDVESEINSYLRVFFQTSPEVVGGRMPDETFIFK